MAHPDIQASELLNKSDAIRPLNLQTAKTRRAQELIGSRSFTESVDNRMISLMRLILAASALLIIYIDPAEPDRFVSVTYGALLLYVLYSIVLYVLVARDNQLLRTLIPWAYWVDVGWYTLLIALSSGTNSIFFFFYFFPVLVASFRLGFSQGLRVAIVSSMLFTCVGYLTAPPEPEFSVNRFLLRPTYLLVLGYMMAYWGESEVTLKRRLALLKEITLLSNPRFGVDHTIGSIMERLRVFYNADTCLFVMMDANSSAYLLRRADCLNSERAVHSERISEEMARGLFALLGECAIIYNNAARARWRGSFYAYDLAKDEHASMSSEAGEAIANLLDTDSFISLPIRRRDQMVGRLYITSKQVTFAPSSIFFLRQAIEQIIPVIENIQLLDKLASEAAEQERQKISRDIHDSVIQPYIGLKLGLDALRQKIAPNSPVTGDIDDLIRVASEEISDLRRYIGGLRSEGSSERGDIMVSSVRRQATKFSELYGIEIDVQAQTKIAINDRLAAEAFQIVREGLSNIKRHTNARSVMINLACENDQLTLQIENDSGGNSPAPFFIPRSITERANALGGTARVEHHDGRTLVRVEIPL